MKIYTQAEFDAIPRDENGVKHCPTGNYTQVHDFSGRCSFGVYSIFGSDSFFGKNSDFGAHCSFGKYSSFDEHCSFGEYSSFAKGCSFGKHSSFAKGCPFGSNSTFAMGCIFGECCTFGKCCSFGEYCIFGVNCSHEGLTNSRYFACDRIGSERRKTYFFAAEEGLYVRAGCFFGTLDDFVKRVKKVHAGTQYEQEYLAAVKLAKIVLEDCVEGGKNTMTLNEYQKLAQRMTNTRASDKIDNGILGICGEGGECANILKKCLFQGHKFNREYMIEECGEILWYVAELAAGLGTTLDEVASRNIEKLKRRYPDGFDAGRSVNREEQ